MATDTSQKSDRFDEEIDVEPTSSAGHKNARSTCRRSRGGHCFRKVRELRHCFRNVGRGNQRVFGMLDLFESVQQDQELYGPA